MVERYAASGVPAALALRTYTSRLLGAEPRLVLHGGGNTSVKLDLPDLLGNAVPVVCVKGSGYDLGKIEPHGHVALRLAPLREVSDLELSDEQMINVFRQNLIDTAAPNPSVETLTHAYIPHAYVDHSHSVTATAIAAQPDSQAMCREIYGDRLAWVPYIMPGFDLSKATARVMRERPDAQGMLLANHGIFSFADSARASYELMIEFVTLGEAYIAERAKNRRVFAVAATPSSVPIAELAPRLRRALAAAAVGPRDATRWLLAHRVSDRIAAFADSPALEEFARRGVATPEHVIRMKPHALALPRPGDDLAGWTSAVEAAVGTYVADYGAYFENNNAALGGGRKPLDRIPRIAVIPGVGVIGIGKSAKEAVVSGEVAEAWIDAIIDAETIGRFASISEREHFAMEHWSLEQVKLGTGVERRLARHVVAVTGGAGAIGAATARAFAAEGAEIAILDLDPVGARTTAAAISASALGIGVDVTDPASVAAAFAQIAAHFGGIDIVVSNAGMALGGALLALDDDALRKSFAVNFYGHHYVAREAVRIMRVQNFGGVLLFNVSKQAVNPGPNFGAYGTSKAALLALVRQYALEHGADRIRVNAVNADRIRSGLLTDAMIEERSRARGLSTQEYLAGNLLHSEVRADDVAQAFLSSALLERTTGNVTTVDGGNVAAMLR